MRVVFTIAMLCAALLVMGAGGVNSLFRFDEWDQGDANNGAIWTQRSSGRRSGGWSNQIALAISRKLIAEGDDSHWDIFVAGDALIFSNSAGGIAYKADLDANLVTIAQNFLAASIPVELDVLSVVVTNNVSHVPGTIAGAGNGNTNYTLLADRGVMYLGSSNVSLSAVMNYAAGRVFRWTAIITNDSANVWGFTVSSVTNRWLWYNAAYGTNRPVTLTNNTALVLEGASEGTNTRVAYYYLNPAK